MARLKLVRKILLYARYENNENRKLVPVANKALYSTGVSKGMRSEFPARRSIRNNEN